jgi:hypothetical protein
VVGVNAAVKILNVGQVIFIELLLNALIVISLEIINIMDFLQSMKKE